MKISRILTLAFTFLLLFNISCRNDNEVMPVMAKGAYENGIFIANEGNFGTPSASVSFIGKDLASVQNNVYSTNNSGAVLGDVLQTIGFSGDNAYLVLNNSNKVEVVNRYTFKKATTITQEINQPRFITFNNNFTYVTNDQYSGPKYLSIYKTSDNSFVKKIAFTDAAENVVAVGSKVFVQNASFGFGNKISIVESSTNNLDKTITIPTGDLNKIQSYNGNAYAISYSGSNSYIYKIDVNGTITDTKTLTGIANGNNLQIYQDKFYFSSDNKVYAMDITSNTVPPAPLFSVVYKQYSSLYGFNVVDGKIFTSDANGFTQNSTVTVYSLTGSVLKTFTTGIGTSGFFQN